MMIKAGTTGQRNRGGIGPWLKLTAGLTATMALAACGSSAPRIEPLPAKFAHVAADSAEGAGAPHIAVKGAPDTRSGKTYLGKYIGPRNDGRSPCGYVSAGPGAQQASAFSIKGASCHTARALAAAAAGHETGRQRVYAAQNFHCQGTRPSAVAVLHYQCTDGRRLVRFVIN